MDKKIIIFSLVLLFIYPAFSKKISDVNSNIPVFSLKHGMRDTVNLINRLSDKDDIFIYYNNWCDRCSKEFKIMYSHGIIDSLIARDVKLFLLTDVVNINEMRRHLSPEQNKTVNENFEIYYEIGSSFVEAIREANNTIASPYILLISQGEIIDEIIGFQENYIHLLEKIDNNKKNTETNKRCPKCKGTGRVTPNPKFGGPDEAVGLCPRCGGSGNF